MNRFTAATISIFFIAQTAYGADLIVETESGLLAPVDLDLFDWSGAYVGGHLGYVTGQQSDNLPSPPEGGKTPLPQTPIDDNSGAALGGLHAGYNWQSDSFVFGLEAMWTSPD